MDDAAGRKGSEREARLMRSIGYRVDGPEGFFGIVQKMPHAGRPRRPLVLVVSDGDTVRLVSLRRVADVVPLERRIVLRPVGAAPIPLARTSTSRTLEAPVARASAGVRPERMVIASGPAGRRNGCSTR